jgi:uncharacterized membrane protein
MKSLLGCLSISLFFYYFSCSYINKTNDKTTKDKYKIVKVEKTFCEKSKIVCKVYDKKGNVPIEGALILITDVKLIGSTSKKGEYEFDITEGEYEIIVMIGNINIKTKKIKFKSYTKTEIKFLIDVPVIECY